MSSSLKQSTTDLFECICDKYCKYPGMFSSQEELDDICLVCEIDKRLFEIDYDFGRETK